MMLAHFGLACEMPAVSNDLDTADGGPPPPPCYLIPWFFNPKRPRSLSNNWPPRANASQVGERILSEFWASHSILSNYWMRLSMISRIIQTEVNVICRSEAEADNIDRGLNNY
jgi:hypothetical protein